MNQPPPPPPRSGPVVGANLVVRVVDVLDQACDRGLQQDEKGQLPGKAHHQGDHSHRPDEGPQQDVDVQTHRLSHPYRVIGQAVGDVTFKVRVENVSEKQLRLRELMVSANARRPQLNSSGGARPDFSRHVTS